MLAYFKTLEEDPQTGITIVHWIKKVVCAFLSRDILVPLSIQYSLSSITNFFCLQFPFFCSDREYIIGRRIWESGKKYYAVTKV